MFKVRYKYSFTISFILFLLLLLTILKCIGRFNRKLITTLKSVHNQQNNVSHNNVHSLISIHHFLILKSSTHVGGRVFVNEKGL